MVKYVETIAIRFVALAFAWGFSRVDPVLTCCYAFCLKSFHLFPILTSFDIKRTLE